MELSIDEVREKMLHLDKDATVVGTEPVRCYSKASEKIIGTLTEFKGYTVWRHSSKYNNELPGEYIFTTLEPKDILCDSKYGSLSKEDYLVAKPGTYKVELVEKDLSKEAYTYLYDDGENKEIPDNIIKEIASLNAIPKEPIKCIIFADDCIETVDDEVMTARYTYCHYLDDEKEENISEEEYYIITVEPENVLFSSLHSNKYIYNYCDLIIKPGIYTLDNDEGDDVESIVIKLDDEITLLKIRIENNKKDIKELISQQSQNEIDLAKLATNLSLVVNYLKDKESNN